MRRASLKLFMLSTVLLLLSISCQPPKQAPRGERTFVTAMDPLQKANFQKVQSPLLSPGESACQRLEFLNGHYAGSSRKYSFIQVVMNPDLLGVVDPKEQAFVSYFLGETFKTPTTEEFYAQMKAAKEQNQIPAELWQQIETAYQSFQQNPVPFKTIMANVLNDKLNSQFPGLFGQPKSISSSFAALQISKVLKTKDAAVFVPFLMKNKTQAPLFHSNDWHHFHSDILKSISAAQKALYQKDSSLEEKFCGLILYNRFFNQLLSLKGFQGITLEETATSEKHSKAVAMTASKLEFTKVPRPGMLVKGSALSIISDEDLRSYDPSKGLIFLNKIVPKANPEMAVLAEQLSFLQAILLMYEATAPWFVPAKDSGINYFGDISSQQNQAILPAQLHPLSLGLLTLSFKNLIAFRNLEAITAEGVSVQIAKEKESQPEKRSQIKEAGVVIGQRENPESKIMKISLDEVSLMLELSVHLDRNFSQLENAVPAECLTQAKQISAQPEGNEAEKARKESDWNQFSESQCGKQISEIASGYSVGVLRQLIFNSDSLKKRLVILRLPLMILAKQLYKNKSGCLAELNWNLENGEKNPKALCNNETKQRAKEAINLMANYTRSALLLEP